MCSPALTNVKKMRGTKNKTKPPNRGPSLSRCGCLQLLGEAGVVSLSLLRVQSTGALFARLWDDAGCGLQGSGQQGQ